MMTAIYFENSDFIELSSASFDRLRQEADRSPLKRARYCLHRDVNDKVHEMVIALRQDTFVQPHRHLDKSESFHLIEGQLLVLFFDDDGQETRRIRLGPPAGPNPFMCRINCPWYHTVIPLTRYVILHETTTGPFNPAAATTAPWAPDPTDPTAAAHFIQQLLNR